ncbi:HEAT repeat domain-containing protein [Corallococcus sp. M7]
MGSRMLWLSLLPGLALAQATPPPVPTKTACTVEGMLDEVRVAMKTGSPAYRKYARLRLKEAAIAMPPEALGRAVSQERDPAVLEAVGAALATKASNAQKPELLQPLLSRASQDADPGLRAAAVRALQGSPSVEFMAKNGGVVTYEQLVRDSAPEVRQAVVENLVTESAGIYFGHNPEMAEAAVKVAAATDDPALAQRLLGEVSMEAASPEVVRKLTQQLRSEDAGLRAAAAKALGGVPGSESAGARRSLTSLYRSDSDLAVRKSALEGLARLGQSGARPLLESLRGVDKRLDPEIDAWLSALQKNLQEWHLLLREKQRLSP